MEILSYITENALILIPALLIIGQIIKNIEAIPDKWIPVILLPIGIAGALLLLYPASFQTGAVILLCCFWGVAATAFNIVCQAEIIKHTQQEATAVAMSIFSGIFNLGIGCGTLLGGAVCTYSSISRIGFAGGLVAVGAFFYCTRRLLKRLNP